MFDNEEDMNAKEKELVIVSESTYNLCEGGKGGFSYINKNLSQEDRLVRSKKGGKNCWTPERRKAQSDIMKVRNRSGTINYNHQPHLGEKNGCAKLTDIQAKEIKYSKDGRKKLADQYNVSVNTIWVIKTGRKWKHIL